MTLHSYPSATECSPAAGSPFRPNPARGTVRTWCAVSFGCDLFGKASASPLEHVRDSSRTKYKWAVQPLFCLVQNELCAQQRPWKCRPAARSSPESRFSTRSKRSSLGFHPTGETPGRKEHATWRDVWSFWIRGRTGGSGTGEGLRYQAAGRLNWAGFPAWFRPKSISPTRAKIALKKSGASHIYHATYNWLKRFMFEHHHMIENTLRLLNIHIWAFRRTSRIAGCAGQEGRIQTRLTLKHRLHQRHQLQIDRLVGHDLRTPLGQVQCEREYLCVLPSSHSN